MIASLATAVLALAAPLLTGAAPSVEQGTTTAPLDKRDSYSGQATWFWDGLGACGWENGDNDPIVALNSDQYTDGWACGKWVTIQNDNTGAQYSAYIADECPSCDWGSLDMSRETFGQLSNWDYDEGVFPITWWFNN